MAAFGDKIQALMDEVYTEWQKEENKGKGKWDVLDGFSAAHQIAVVLGNFNYQVENGGLEQWIYNGYFHDDAEKLIEYLEIGAESDERCRTILDRIYKLDQYAQETDCDRYGNFYDEDGESSFIGDMINCGTFDTWYYEKCDEDNWWQVVCGIIDKVEGRESALVRKDEHDGENAATHSPLRVYIENLHDDSIGGFTMPLPTTMEALQPFFDGAEITGWQDMKVWEVRSDINGLGDAINKTINKTVSPDTLDELNYLAARIQGMSESGLDIFCANIEAGRNCGSVTEMINLTFSENLNCFDVQPAFNAEQYGDFLVNMWIQDEHADAFNRLNDSDDPADRALAAHIEKLEAHIDKAAFGRTTVKEENGVFTNHGYLTGGDGMQDLYKEPEDIPAEYRLLSRQDEIVRPLVKIENTDIAAALVKLCAVGGEYTHDSSYILKELAMSKDKDFLFTINTNGTHFYPAIDAYKRGDAVVAGIIASLAGEPGTRFFALRVSQSDRNGNGKLEISGEMVELNREAFRANAARHCISPDRIDATMTDSSKCSYDLWSWADMPIPYRSQIAGYESHYSEDDMKKAHRRFDNYRSTCADECITVSEAELLIEINSAYMAAAENPQPDMIRITNEAAKEVLARGDADVYRLTPSGAEKLAPIDAARSLCFAEHRDLAIKREDVAGLDKWAKRTADKMLRQNERSERDKSKNRTEEL